MIALIILLIGLLFRNNINVGSLGRVIGKIFFAIGLFFIVIYVIVILAVTIAAIISIISLFL